ncbi:hypothetical protein BgiBS90_026316 [Biomphalaria glabrata]|nr:hypothetical protein BgiBS90_026316 [Biomphalaria glabrata]
MFVCRRQEEGKEETEKLAQSRDVWKKMDAGFYRRRDKSCSGPVLFMQKAINRTLVSTKL